MKKRGLSILLVLCMVLALLPFGAMAWNGGGIRNNGLDGLYIDIYSDPYTTYASKPWGDSAYTASGCTWFAAARVHQITGTDTTIWSGANWYNSAYANYGYTRGTETPTGKALACYENHVSVIESVVGDTALVSEGGVTSYPGNDYCAISKMSMSTVRSSRGGAFLGFVYLTSPEPPFNKNNNTLSQDYGNVFYAYIIKESPWVHLEAADGKNGSNVQLAARRSSVPKQIWRFERTSDGSFIITNEYSGKALEVAGSKDWDGANVSLWDYLGGAGARWFLSVNTSTSWTSYIFTPGHCDLVMDCADNGSSGGTNIQIYTRNGTGAQNFAVYPLTLDGDNYVKPSKPAASSVTTTEAVAGTPTTISWTNSALVNKWDARTYTLTVKDSSGNTVLNKSGLTDTSYSFTFSEAGTYTAQVTAVNTMYYDYKTVGSAKTITVKTSCEANGHVWDSGVITQEPTATADGVKTYTCTVCGATRTETVPKLSNPFTDVTQGKFYYDPVLWAISQDPQITTGVTDTTFEPDRTCTRAHVVTFLWRANGCPNPTNMTSNFKDVKDTSKYYYKAVLWAAEKGITTGYADGTFRPDDECTRGQVVTFLWRAKGQPTPTSAANPFSDVPAGKYYTTAVLWALQNNITQGRTSTTFGPDDACTRGHVVTFLYRAYA